MSLVHLKRWTKQPGQITERDMPRGHWFPLSKGDRECSPDGVHAIITCPDCGKSCALKHTVAADGTVTPSMVCPHKPCPWHVWGVLDDWTP